jgi:hypothetical protein
MYLDQPRMNTDFPTAATILPPISCCDILAFYLLGSSLVFNIGVVQNRGRREQATDFLSRHSYLFFA